MMKQVSTVFFNVYFTFEIPLMQVQWLGMEIIFYASSVEKKCLSPSCHSKPAFNSFCCGTQEKIF